MSPKGKARSANTGAKDGVEPRHDDLLWKDLLTRFFVPMLQSLLPDLAHDPAAYIKLMTDGILLAETQGDPPLAQYDTAAFWSSLRTAPPPSAKIGLHPAISVNRLT